MKIKGICVSVIQVVLLVMWSVCVGLFAVDKLHIISMETNVFLLISLCFFVGLVLILISFRFLDLIVLDIRVACYVTLFFASLLGVSVIWNGELFYIFGQLSITHIIVFMGAFLAVGISMLLFYIDYSEQANSVLSDGEVGVYTNLGTAHTPRSVNVAKIAMRERRIPMLGINYGLPLVMMMFEVLKSPYTYFMQFLYYCVNNALVCFFIMGYMMEYWGVSVGFALLSTVVVLFATEELSFRYKLCTDATSCTNWGITKYPDIWMMMCILLFYLRMIFANEAWIGTKYFLSLVFFTIMCTVAWSLIAPQLSVMMAGLLGCNVFIWFATGKREEALGLCVLFSIISIGTMVTARIGGGMFQKKEKVRNDIEGNRSGGQLSLGYRGICLRDIVKMDFYHLETMTTRNVVLILSSFAFPLITLSVSVIEMCSGFQWWTIFLAFQVLILFCGGFVLEYFLTIGTGGKMELLRFSAPVFVISKIAWMGIIAYTIQTEGINSKSIVQIGLAIYMIASSIPFHIQWMKRYSTANIKDVLKVWFQTPQIVTGSGFYSTDSIFYDNIIKKNVERIHSLEELRGKSIYIYGTGEYASKLYASMQTEKAIHVKGFIDSNPQKWGKKIDEKIILAPWKAAQKQKGEMVIIGSEMKASIVGIYSMCSEHRLRNVKQLSL